MINLKALLHLDFRFCKPYWIWFLAFLGISIGIALLNRLGEAFILCLKRLTSLILRINSIRPTNPVEEFALFANGSSFITNISLPWIAGIPKSVDDTLIEDSKQSEWSEKLIVSKAAEQVRQKAGST